MLDFDFIDSMSIYLKNAILITLIIVGALILTRTVRWLIDKSFAAASAKIKVDPTRYKFFKNAASLIIWIIALGALTLFIPRFKALAITLFAGAGILVAIIGFAAQQAFSNIISGIFIVMFRPFRVGDMVKVGTLDYGIVEDITLRHTVIINFENKRIIIPNAVVGAETIVNDHIEDEKICRWIEVGISYDSDVDLAIKIIQEVAIAHRFSTDHRSAQEKANGVEQVQVRLMNFGDFSVNLRASVWTYEPINAREMHSDINKEIKKRFDAEGIEIPFPYRTLVYKNDLPKNAQPKSNA